jgi:uncharacterized protein (TIGR01777 family)
MRVLVTGGTGFLGRPLRRALEAGGHSVTVVSREPGRVPARSVGWGELDGIMSETDAVVNLAGASIADGRWSDARKRAIRESRVESTRALVAAMRTASPRPRVLVNASASGFYGDTGDDEVDEGMPAGSGFLADVCRAWEAEAVKAEPLEVRVVRARLGVILGPDGGALARMLLPFRAFIGGPLGSGRQWMSWIQRDDVVQLVRTAVENEALTGPVNVTAPSPVRNADFARVLGHVLDRPAVLPTPAFALRLALGEMATMLLTGQRVLPAAALAAGYEFRYPELDGALRASID